MAAGEPAGPSQPVIKRLFARSGNRCAFPKCRVALVQGKTVVGRICHIKGRNGPRYDASQTPAERHGYDNLVLLCPTHHAIVDDDSEAYTVERLTKMKADHEGRAASLGEAEIERAATLLRQQSISSTNQSGGITAHTVNVHIQPAGTAGSRGDDQRSIVKRIRRYHEERVGAIVSGHAPVPLIDGPALVMHIMPFTAVDDEPAPAFVELCRDPNRLLPIKSSHALGWRITVDGLITGSNAEGLSKPQRAFVHLRRSGAIEAFATSIAVGRDHTFVELPEVQAIIIKHVDLYARALGTNGLEPPMVVLVSLIHASGMRLLRDFTRGFPEDVPVELLQFDQIHFNEAVLDKIPDDYRVCARMLSPLLSHMANAAGLRSSPYFDADGTYRPARHIS